LKRPEIEWSRIPVKAINIPRSISIAIKTVIPKGRVPSREKVCDKYRAIYTPLEQRTRPGRVNQYKGLNSIFIKL
jgi:hypothetical protein